MYCVKLSVLIQTDSKERRFLWNVQIIIVPAKQVKCVSHVKLVQKNAVIANAAVKTRILAKNAKTTSIQWLSN